jgi:hypothetical protein
MHQNIRGLLNKNDKLMCSLLTNQIKPHFFCVTEHFLCTHTLSFVNWENYSLGCSYLRTLFQSGGVCIFIRNDFSYVPLHISENCYEKIIELYAMQVNTKFSHFITICMYRSSSGNFDQFLTLLDFTWKHLYRPWTEFLTCGGKNVNYLMNSYR